METRQLESQLVLACLDYLNAKRIFAWRQNTVGIYDPSKQIFRKFTGLPGVSDILGIINVGGVGRFFSCECKIKPRKPTEDQELFMEKVTENGGYALLVYSIDELDSDIKELMSK